jgi:hypothetical protein
MEVRIRGEWMNQQSNTKFLNKNMNSIKSHLLINPSAHINSHVTSTLDVCAYFMSQHYSTQYNMNTFGDNHDNGVLVKFYKLLKSMNHTKL